MSTEASSTPEQNLQAKEVDPLAKAWGEFTAHRDHIVASSKLPGVKDVIYDEEYLRRIVGDLLRHRPANVRVSIIYIDKDGQEVKKVVDSSLLAFQNVANGSQTMFYSEEALLASAFQSEIDEAFHSNERNSESPTLQAIMLEEGLRESEQSRPLSVSITDVHLDSPAVDVVAQNIVQGAEVFDQHDGDTAYSNVSDGQRSTEFVIDFKNENYQVIIQREQAGGERVPGLDVQIGMLLFEQLGLSHEEAGNLGDLGPVYSKLKDVPAGDAF